MIVSTCTLITLRAEALRKAQLGITCIDYLDYFYYLQCENNPKPNVCESECTYTTITSDCDFQLSQVTESTELCNNFIIT